MNVIETNRLCLRELIIEDKKELMRVLTDPESMEYYPHPFSEEEVEKWIRWNIENYTKYKHGLWAVILKETEIFIGDCGITFQNIGNEILPEIGFHIIKEHCNKGYATEAALACKEYAFKVLRYPKIYSYTAVRNIPSQIVAEKMGMKICKFFNKNGEKHVVHVAVQECSKTNDSY